MSIFWISMIGCGETEVKKSEDRLSDTLSTKATLDSSLIYQTWYDSLHLLAFTIHASGYIEFLQAEFATGELKNPFLQRDSIFFNFADSSFKLKMKSCALERFTIPRFSKDGYYAGEILELTATSLKLDAFIVDFEAMGEDTMKFVSIDPNTFLMAKNESTFSADLHLSRIRDGVLIEENNFQLNLPEIASRIICRGSIDDDSVLRIEAHFIDYPCVYDYGESKIINLVVDQFVGAGKYEQGFSERHNSDYTELHGDALDGFEADTTSINILEYVPETGHIKGEFSMSGKRSYDFGNADVFTITTNGHFDFYLNE